MILDTEINFDSDLKNNLIFLAPVKNIITVILLKKFLVDVSLKKTFLCESFTDVRMQVFLEKIINLILK